MKEIIRNLFLFIIKVTRKDAALLRWSHYANGIMKYQNSKVSGEDFFLNYILKPYFLNRKIDHPVIFDVGANSGVYSKNLISKFPSSLIFAFEPNPDSFQKLVQATTKISNLKALNLGLGSEEKDTVIYSYKDKTDSEHASLLKEVFTDLHHANDLAETKIRITTIENFCHENDLSQIDFLKIDTEGYELEVLKGAYELIEQKKINIIQFEFNEMNIVFRVFLKDFYNLLKEFMFFRLDTDRLIPLNEYNPINEIFRFQNLLAVRKGILIKGI